MRPRVVLEMLVVLGVVGLALELAEGHTWVLIASGVAAAIWLLARSY
ncbi:MAG: hypothetical protein ABI600_01435 [Luteolibacter sp.]